MIHASIRMVIPLQKQKEALSILEAAAEDARAQKGCIYCQVYKGVKDKRLFHFEQHWDSEEEMNRYLRSDKYLAVLLVLEMALERPIVKFDQIASTSGIDTIETVRLKQKAIIDEAEEESAGDE